MLENLLHLTAFESVEAEDLGDCPPLNNFGNYLLTFAQLYDFLLALVIKDIDDALERLSYVAHAHPKLILYLIEPLEHASKPWS